jgi:hypothetical protein
MAGGVESPAGDIDLTAQLAAITGWLASLPTTQLPGKLLVDAWHGTRRQAALGAPLLCWLLLHNLGRLLGCAAGSDCLAWLHRYGLDYAWQEQASSPEQQRGLTITSFLMQTSSSVPHPADSAAAFAQLCIDPAITGLLGINTHAGSTWFLQEGMTALAGAVALQAAIMPLDQPEAASGKAATAVIAGILRQRLARAAAVGYRLDKFLHLG